MIMLENQHSISVVANNCSADQCIVKEGSPALRKQRHSGGDPCIHIACVDAEICEVFFFIQPASWTKKRKPKALEHSGQTAKQ